MDASHVRVQVLPAGQRSIVKDQQGWRRSLWDTRSEPAAADVSCWCQESLSYTLIRSPTQESKEATDPLWDHHSLSRRILEQLEVLLSSLNQVGHACTQLSSDLRPDQQPAERTTSHDPSGPPGPPPEHQAAHEHAEQEHGGAGGGGAMRLQTWILIQVFGINLVLFWGGRRRLPADMEDMDATSAWARSRPRPLAQGLSSGDGRT